MTAAPRPERMKRARLIHKVPPENEVHCMIADMLRFGITPGWFWWHTPNGGERPAFITKKGKRVSIEAGRLKRMGVKPGISDFLVLSPLGDLHALELKKEGKSPTSDQIDFLEIISSAGGKSAWVDNFDDAVRILRDWGALRIR